METAELDARARGLFQLLHNRAARPEVRQSAGDKVGQAQPQDERHPDDERQPVLQSEFSLSRRSS